MKKVLHGFILIKDIKHIENSRMRELDDVADLMNDVEQRGLLEPIGIRKNDNALIYGNRRVKAYEKLGYEKIECDFYDGVSDDDLLIANLAENLKRKNIGSIEIGRICVILQSRKMTGTEIANKLGIPRSRVESSIAAFNITKGTPFERLVTFGKRDGIPESLIWKIQTSLMRARKLTKEDWNFLLTALEKNEITTEHISQLRSVILSNPELSMEKALDVLKRCRIIHSYLTFNMRELNNAMVEEHCRNENEFIRLLIRKYNKNLLF